MARGTDLFSVVLHWESCAYKTLHRPPSFCQVIQPINVLAHIERAKNSLAELATVYLVTEAAGQSQAILDAKRRDLQRFLSFYQGLYRNDQRDPVIRPQSTGERK